MVYYGKELYHHGVDGQKWGIRKYQNKDGSYTPLGQRENNGAGRYGDWREENRGHSTKSSTKAKNTSTAKLEKNTTAKTNDTPNNRVPNERLKRVLAYSAAGAAVALGVGAAFYISSKMNAGDYIKGDITLKAGEMLQRISPSEEKELHDTFYAAFDKRDIKRYEGMLPLHYKMRGADGTFAKQIIANNDIKIAGHDTAKKVLEDVMKDPDNKMVAQLYGIRNYDTFNQYVAARNLDGNMSKIYKQYFDKLKSLGYSGLVDINDQKYSGYGAKAPVILFNDSNAFSVKSTKEVKFNIAKYAVEQGKALADHFVRNDLSDEAIQFYAGQAMTGASIGMYTGIAVSSIKASKEKKQNAKKTK